MKVEGVELTGSEVNWERGHASTMRSRSRSRRAQDHIRWVLQQREYLDEEMLEWLEAKEKPLSIRHTYRAWQDSGIGMLYLNSRVPE